MPLAWSASSRSAHGSGPSGLRAPTLGRDRELARLERAVANGAVGTVIVAPPGVGKSRLAAEFAATANARGALVLRARVRPDALGPYEVVAQLLAAAGGREQLAECDTDLRRRGGRRCSLRSSIWKETAPEKRPVSVASATPSSETGSTRWTPSPEAGRPSGS